MLEQRNCKRWPVSTRVEIVPPIGGSISGRMTDISTGGACLEVQSIFGIPDRFHVKVISNDELFSAIVIWKGPKVLGVVFEDEPDRHMPAFAKS